MRRRLRIATTLAVLATLPSLACGSSDQPVRKSLGPTKVEGNLERTPVKFGTTSYFKRPRTTEAEEGRLSVPESRSGESERTIKIHFVRFPAEKGASGYPTVYLAGGPGGSGTWSAAGDRYPLFQRLREVGDVIALDQRGTWGSEPYMVCDGAWSYPLDRPSDPALMAETVAPFLKRCAEEWGAKADLSAYNTVESAEDLDDLRAALGAEKLNLWGISYGTHLGLAYIRQHPDRVNRAVLAGIEGPDHSYKLPENVDRVLMRVAEAVKADPKARKALPDFTGGFEKLLQELEEKPARVEIVDPKSKERHTVVIGPLDMQRGLFNLLGERPDIEELVVRAAPVMKRDFSAVAQAIYQGRRNNRELVMSLSMDCASAATAKRLETIRKQAETTLLGDAANYSLRAKCASWPVTDLGDAFRGPIRSDVPVLFISGNLDAKTPPSNAEEILEGFENGLHLVIENGSHDDDLFLSSPRIVEEMVTFLKGGDPDVSPIVLPPLEFKQP